MRLAAYQPDIPQNLGALIRIAACFDTPLDVIGPCGFPLSSKDLRRAALDYGDRAQVSIHPSWNAFSDAIRTQDARLILLTTRGDEIYTDVPYRDTDILLLGRESAGAPQSVHDAADVRIKIPLAEGTRSLNIAVAAGIAIAEARRRFMRGASQ